MSQIFLRTTKIVAALILCTSLTTAQSEDSNKLATYFYQKCQNVTRDNKLFDKIYYESGELFKELSYAVQNLPQNKRIFCKDNRPSLVKHFNSINTDLELCLLPKEKFLSGFLKNSFSKFLEFLCDNNGGNIDTFFRASASQCRSQLESNTDNEVGTCFGKIFKPSGGYLSQNDLCDDLNTARKCFDVVLDEKCPNYQQFKQLNSEFFKYITTDCSSPNSSTRTYSFSSILLLLLGMISYITR